MMRSRSPLSTFSMRSVALWFICILFATLAPLRLELLYAQDVTPIPVTDDQVNEIAGRMYCPSCQGVPLDVCGTQVCIQWRDEIRTQLEAGRTSDEIVANFVTLYGERIVGTPQDPLLRAFSLITPYIIAIFVLLAGLWTIIRWRRSRRVVIDDDLLPTKAKVDDDYRARIEQDLQ
jgi:cytochrome c-type biogenesis protein CcmH/NrfF